MKDLSTIRRIIEDYHAKRGDYQGWFEALYAAANGRSSEIPWAKLQAHPYFTRWANSHNLQGTGENALVVGCGLGDDAEALATRGFDVTAFDLSETAIRWCKRRFWQSEVTYQVADMFNPPEAWQHNFDFVLEINTVQAIPPQMRAETIQAIANFVAPGGRMLLIGRGRQAAEDEPGPPWPLTRDDIRLFETHGLQAEHFESFNDYTGIKRFRVLYHAYKTKD